MDNINIVNILKSKPQQNSGTSHTNQTSLSNVISLAGSAGHSINNKPRNNSNGITKNALEQTDNLKE